MPELHVVGAGSLLEFTLRSSGFRMPVGRIQYLVLRPLSAGKTGRLRSLKQFMTEYDCPLGVRISQAPMSFQHGILSVPLYAIDQVPRLIRAAQQRAYS